MSTRFSPSSVILLIITVASLMFGAYSFIANDSNLDSPPSNQRKATTEDDNTDVEDSSSLESPSSDNILLPRESDPTSTDVYKVAENSGIGQIEAIASNPTDKGDAAISGRVLKIDGSVAVGANVTAQRSGLKLTPPEFTDGDINKYRQKVSELLARASKESRTITTNSEGQFQFTGLDASLSYNIVASTSRFGVGSVERVAAGDTVTILLKKSKSLIGKVLTAEGQEISEFTVSIWRKNQNWDKLSQTFTTENGTFSMPTPWERIQVEIKTSGYTQDKPAEVNIAESSEQTYVLQRAAFITGVIKNKSGEPLAEVRVSTGTVDNRRRRNRRRDDHNDAVSTVTDSLGRYNLDTLPAKELSISASLGEVSDTQRVTLVTGENQLDFTLDIGATISIRTTNPSSEPIDVSQVWFESKSGDWPKPERMTLKELGLTEFVGLAPGEYTIHLTVEGFAALKRSVTVLAGDNEFSFQVLDGAMLTGKVTGNDGQPLKNVTIRLRKQDEDKWGGWGTGKSTRADGEGTFKLGPAEAGSWLLEAYSNDGFKNVYSTTISIIAGDNEHNISVDTGSGLEVTVVDEEGKKVSWGQVRVQGEKSFRGDIDANGIANIQFIVPGEYTISATANGKASVATQIFLSSRTLQLTLTVKSANACRVTQVFPDSQAFKVGIQKGDLIVEYGSVKILNWRQLGKAKNTVKDGEDSTITIVRNGQLHSLPIKGGTIGIDGEDAVR